MHQQNSHRIGIYLFIYLANAIIYSSVKGMTFFSILKISKEFLFNDPTEWINDANYKSAKDKIKSLKVVNDTAERSVALM